MLKVDDHPLPSSLRTIAYAVLRSLATNREGTNKQRQMRYVPSSSLVGLRRLYYKVQDGLSPRWLRGGASEPVARGGSQHQGPRWLSRSTARFRRSTTATASSSSSAAAR